MHQTKVRINDLAREMEVKSKSILDALPLAGIFQKKTHSSSLDADDADKVRAYFRAKQVPSGQAGTRSVRSTRAKDDIRTKIDLSHLARPGDVLKAIGQSTKTPPGSAAQSTVPRASQPSAQPVRGQPIYRRPLLGQLSASVRSAIPAKLATPTASPLSPRVTMPHRRTSAVYTESTTPHPLGIEAAAATSEEKMVTKALSTRLKKPSRYCVLKKSKNHVIVTLSTEYFNTNVQPVATENELRLLAD